MPCRSDVPVLHNFPSNFPLDTDYLSVALAEHNHKLGLIGVTLTFGDLDSAARSAVLARAQELKTGQRSRRPSAIVKSEPDPWWIRAGLHLYHRICWGRW